MDIFYDFQIQWGVIAWYPVAVSIAKFFKYGNIYSFYNLHIQSPYIFKFPKKYYTDLEYFAASIDTIRIFWQE